MIHAAARAATLAALVLVATVPAPAETPDERARRVHASAIVIDTHLDVPYALKDKPADLSTRGVTDHVDVPRMKEGGLGAGFLALYVPSSYASKGGAARLTLELSDVVDRVIAASPELVAVTDVKGIRAAHAAGRIGILKGIEGGHAIEDSLGALRAFHALGVRYVTLTHTNTNHWADSSGSFWSPDFDPAEVAVHGGLSPFGEQVVKEMNRLGIAVDVSHVSDATIEDALRVSRAPIFASHSSCRAISPIPRNLTDEQIRAIGAKGGVVMVNFGSQFLSRPALDAYVAFRDSKKDEYLATKAKFADPVQGKEEADKILDAWKGPRATLADAADCIVHALKLAPGGVGLGSDFDGIEDPPNGLDDVSKLPGLTRELLARGLSEDEVKGVLGENFLRFLERVEKTSADLRSEAPAVAKAF